MTIDINQFWNLLTESQLVNVSQTQALFTGFASDETIPKTPEALAAWLVEQKAISDYQAEIISSGHSGPFQYGNYTIVDRLDPGFQTGQFNARHTKTGYPVLLQFFAGSQTEHLGQWQQIETLVESIAQLQHPNVVETFESVVAPNHRFVVSQRSGGSTIASKLPRKARLPWQAACAVIAQVATGLDHLHQNGVVHQAVSPRTIWLEKNGLVQVRLNPIPDTVFDLPQSGEKGGESKFDYLAPESYRDGYQSTPTSDTYSLGCTLYRIIGGRPPFQEPDLEKKKQAHLRESPGDLSKYEIPEQLDSLLKQMMAKNPTARPESMAEIANLLGLLSGKADEFKSLAPKASQPKLAYRSSLRQLLPGADPLIESIPDLAPIKTSGESSHLGDDEPTAASDQRQAKIQAAAEAALKRKNNRWKVPVAIAASLLALTGVIGILALNADRTVVEKSINENPETPVAIVNPPENNGGNNDHVESGVSPNDLAAIPPELRPTVLQQLIDDDDQSIWETPTNGPPIQFSYLPVSPKMIFAFRTADLAGLDEGRKLLKSLGPKFELRIKQFEILAGLDLQDIDQLVVSLHTNEQFEYEPYFTVRLKQPVKMDQLMQNWNRPAKRQLNNQQEIHDSPDGSTAYYILYETIETDDPDPDVGGDDATDKTDVVRFAFGNKRLVEEVALSLGATALSGSFRTLADWTDRDRHVNVLFLRNSLFNDEGQKLMGPELRPFNRELRVMFPDEVRGGLLSLHLDSGNYIEFMLDKTLDLKAVDLKDAMTTSFRNQRDKLMQFVASIPPSPYWDKVRIRYGGMLADVYRNLRWDVEHGQVVANCWLPPMAAHNLLAASELIVAFSSGSSTAAAPTATGPQTLDELLATKRDLNIANPPDLNVLMADLQTEIKDDFGKLPFAFNIQLVGADLEADGITKNQRPGELVINQKTLAEILTFIMISANPDKNISGPADPNCKLIWVVADDPENPGQKAILVTTRKAAAAKSYELPPAFRTE